MVGQVGILALTILLFAGNPLRAQSAGPVAAPAALATDSPSDQFAFEVATFKPSDPNGRGFSGGFMPSGYRVTDFELSYIVFSAYFPLNSHDHRLIGMPDWAEKEHYDVVARVDEATANSWTKLSPLQRQPAGRAMLQKLLADRCKLVAHLVPTQVDGYALVISKGGPHLTPTKPGETYPSDAKNDGDGAKVAFSSPRGASTVDFYNATVEQLAEMLGWAWDIHDQTNLTGRYDFTIRRLELPVDAEGKRIADPQPNDLWDISGTGLEIKHAKIESENLVIDHIERPSPN